MELIGVIKALATKFNARSPLSSSSCLLASATVMQATTRMMEVREVAMVGKGGAETAVTRVETWSGLTWSANMESVHLAGLPTKARLKSAFRL